MLRYSHDKQAVGLRFRQSAFGAVASSNVPAHFVIEFGHRATRLHGAVSR
ncbi:MAG TPA: hypothetical protein VE423_01610 [Microvirga sp.]|nr:hypothetical protein [Microvirga sp.]